MRVLNALKTWVDRYYLQDFVQDRALLTAVVNFGNEQNKAAYGPPVDMAIDVVRTVWVPSAHLAWLALALTPCPLPRTCCMITAAQAAPEKAAGSAGNGAAARRPVASRPARRHGRQRLAAKHPGRGREAGGGAPDGLPGTERPRVVHGMCHAREVSRGGGGGGGGGTRRTPLTVRGRLYALVWLLTQFLLARTRQEYTGPAPLPADLEVLAERAAASQVDLSLFAAEVAAGSRVAMRSAVQPTDRARLGSRSSASVLRRSRSVPTWSG